MTFIVFTINGEEIGIPAHITILSERFIALQSNASFIAFWIIISESFATLHRTGETPHWIISCLETFLSGVTAITICSGRKLPIILAVFPWSVGIIIAFAFMFLASLYALWVTRCPMSCPGMYEESTCFILRRYSSDCSVVCVMSAIVFTASTGYFPPAVSPLSITASVPSKTAFETSVSSARVGRGFKIMESSICVAVITGLPAFLQHRIIAFCARGIFSVGSWTPKSPRAIIIPSASFTICSILLRPSSFSIFAIIFAVEFNNFK